MKIYVAKVTKTEKNVYLSGVRYTKKDDKYNLVPVNVSVKPENYHLVIKAFPVIADVQFVKGTGAIVNKYEKV